MQWFVDFSVREHTNLCARTEDGWLLNCDYDTSPFPSTCPISWSVSVESPGGLFLSDEVESEQDAKRWCEAVLAMLREFEKKWKEGE